MNAFMKFLEINWQESSISKLAKELINKPFDISEIDKPLLSKSEVDNVEKKKHDL